MGPPERRSVRKIRFSAAEWEVVVAHAQACGRAPARHVREMALGVAPRISQTRANARIIRELSALVTELQRARGAIPAPVIQPSDDAELRWMPDVASMLDRVVNGLLASIGRLT